MGGEKRGRERKTNSTGKKKHRVQEFIAKGKLNNIMVG